MIRRERSSEVSESCVELREVYLKLTDVHVYDCARNESGPSVVYSSGEDVKSEEGARRGPRDPESRVGSCG